MHISARLFLTLATLALSATVHAQIDEDQLGGWYMYFFDARSDDSQWGFQCDIQYRNWDLIGDLEQLLLRGGLTWRPKSNDALLTLGVANITSGEFGPGDSTTNENRIYQEALLPQKIGERVYLRHRFRYEQRWVDGQDFRTRFRYGLFMNIPLNRVGCYIPGGKYPLISATIMSIQNPGRTNVGNCDGETTSPDVGLEHLPKPDIPSEPQDPQPKEVRCDRQKLSPSSP